MDTSPLQTPVPSSRRTLCQLKIKRHRLKELENLRSTKTLRKLVSSTDTEIKKTIQPKSHQKVMNFSLPSSVHKIDG
jgi:hypothetical protein